MVFHSYTGYNYVPSLFEKFDENNTFMQHQNLTNQARSDNEISFVQTRINMK